MKDLTKLFILLFSIAVVFCSCTVTKRHFGKGYYIEWNQKHRTAETNSSEKIVSSEEISPAETGSQKDTIQVISNESAQEIRPVIESIEQQEPVKKQEKPRILKKLLEKKLEKIADKLNPRPDDRWDMEDEEPKIHPLTWAIMGVLTLGVACIGLMMVNIFFIFGVGGFAFIGLILGIIALVSVKKHPEKYKKRRLTKFFALFTIIAGSIVVGVLGLFFLLAYLLY
ncbi:DUF4190 domain-containing protein [Fluviicola taffensis]|uniref:Uncharacterized protein n=1 Tax=Fluviicola taffensis (strain DSM 16823 / NCIMB 13979 / RW262) TaxID=755732 RepID=F2IF89_FLUTR|nr:DUF4190 domain-containing protein [Fluviicola taffensis]AEA43563.1 hypothetical protein Fluta_1571 [Fluviicola taffensis DSM 16823]